MRVLVIGASGYIGNAVAKAFRAKGHTVYGSVRNKEDARSLSLEEIGPIMADLSDPKSFHDILQSVEVAVHCAHESSAQEVERDAQAIDTILDLFSHQSLPRSFIYTSGVWVYGSLGYKMADESTPLNPLDVVKWRPAHEEKVLKAASSQLRTVVLRPAHVYGSVGGLTHLLFTSAGKGSMAMVGEGHNRIPMIHVRDLAHAYVSAAERELTSVVLNVADDSTATFREMVEAVARVAGIEGKIQALSSVEAKKQWGSYANVFTLDLTIDNSRIKRLLGWQIHHAPFIYEVQTYYDAWKAMQETEEF